MILRKIIPAIIFTCFVSGMHAQEKVNNDIRYWSKVHPLTFSDFKGSPAKEDTTLREAAPNMLTHKLGGIVESIDVRLLTEKGKTTFTIKAGMKKSLSWIKADGDSITLRHEQGHFDICEIYARMLRRDIKNATTLSAAKDIYEKVTTHEATEQYNYDKENTYQSGGITNAWKNKISARLKELELNESVIVILPIYQ